MGSDLFDLEIFGTNLDVSFLCMSNLILLSISWWDKHYIKKTETKNTSIVFTVLFLYLFKIYS